MTRNELGSMELCTSDIFWLVSIIHFSLLVTMYEEIFAKSICIYQGTLFPFASGSDIVWHGLTLLSIPPGLGGGHALQCLFAF